MRGCRRGFARLSAARLRGARPGGGGRPSGEPERAARERGPTFARRVESTPLQKKRLYTLSRETDGEEQDAHNAYERPLALVKSPPDRVMVDQSMRLAGHGWKPHRDLLIRLLKKPITGLNLLVYAWSTEFYGIIEFETSGSTISRVCRHLSINGFLPTSAVGTVFGSPSRCDGDSRC